VNNTFPLPQQGQYQQYNPNNSSGQITGGENSTFFPGTGGIPLPGGAPDIPGDTTSDPNTGPSGSNDPGSQDSSQVIKNLGYDPSDPRNFDPSGFGSGRPTQKAIGLIGNFLGNFAFPGLGMLTGPVASKITQMIQNGASRSAVQNAIAKAQSGGDVTVGDPTDVTGAGGGKDNTGSGGYYDPSYLASIGYGPGQGNKSMWPGSTGNWGYLQDVPGSVAYDPTGPAAGGFGGGVAGGGGSFFHDLGGVRGGPIAGGAFNLGASGGGLAPGMANLYLHSAPMQSWAQNQGYNSVGDWLNKTGFSLAGGNPSGANLSGAGRPMTSSR
jgi:hypothetical protein